MEKRSECLDSQQEKGILPPGWHYDEDTGAIMRDVIHRMGRRCFAWDYCCRAAYLVTMTLADRSRPLFGRLVGQSAETAAIELTELGHAIDAHMRRIGDFTPEIEVLGIQLMPEHLHAVLRVKQRMKKPLGIALRGFKGGASQIYWRLCACTNHEPLFSEGYVDNILGDEEAVTKALCYIADNPRRLWEKHAHPELFKVLRDIEVKLAVCTASANSVAPVVQTTGHFSAIGNLSLLQEANIFQVQCSRSFFAYNRASDGTLLKDAPPAIVTKEYEEKRNGFLEAAEHGAVLLSTCISHGEREIARLAFIKGLKVITLANKGFNPLYKPGGKLFNPCANGNLLMLAPAAWPYIPGEKKMTREDACVLNRIGQWLAGTGAVDIRYCGIEPRKVDELAFAAIQISPS